MTINRELVVIDSHCTFSPIEDKCKSVYVTYIYNYHTIYYVKIESMTTIKYCSVLFAMFSFKDVENES